MADIYLYEVAAGADILLREPGVAAIPVADTTKPTFTGDLTYTATSSSITVSWAGTTSADNIVVARREYRIGGSGAYTRAIAAEETAKAHTFENLDPSTAYQIDMRCVDTSENVSEPLTIGATTAAPTAGGGTTNYVRCKLAARPGAPHRNLATIHWSLFRQLLPSAFGAPAAKGTRSMVQGSDLLEIPVPAATVPAGWYMLILTDPDGTTTLASPIQVGP